MDVMEGPFHSASNRCDYGSMERGEALAAECILKFDCREKRLGEAQLSVQVFCSTREQSDFINTNGTRRGV